jgi:hypothetical protein
MLHPCFSNSSHTSFSDPTLSVTEMMADFADDAPLSDETGPCIACLARYDRSILCPPVAAIYFTVCSVGELIRNSAQPTNGKRKKWSFSFTLFPSCISTRKSNNEEQDVERMVRRSRLLPIFTSWRS